MNRTKMQSWIDQADAMVNAQMERFKMKLGELPDINVGKIAGKAVDFLRRQGVPVTGYKSNVQVILELKLDGAKPIIDILPLKESVLPSENRRLLKALVDEFIARHGEEPRQTIQHGIIFVIDETQLDPD